MKKDGTKLSTLQRLGKQSRSLRFGYFFSGLPNLRKSQPHFEVVIGPNLIRSAGAAIFGASLHDILERSSFTTKGGLCIPYVLHRLFSEISRKGIRSEGLFRLSGSAPKILQLETRFSKGPDYGKSIDLSTYDVHTLAGTFKKLLRSLPEPVIPHSLHVYYLNGFRKSASDEQNLALLSSLGHRMDRQHFDLLKYIIAVAAYVESEKAANKMTAEALAIVLAPTCTGLDSIMNRLPATNPLASSLGRFTFSRSMSSNSVRHLSVVKDLEQWTSLFQFMITHHEGLLRNWTGVSADEADKESVQSIQEADWISVADVKAEDIPESPTLAEEVTSAVASLSAFDTGLRFSFEDFVLPEITMESFKSTDPHPEIVDNVDEVESNMDNSSNSNSDDDTQQSTTDSAEDSSLMESQGANSKLEDSLLSKSETSISCESTASPRYENPEEKYERESNYRRLLDQWKSREVAAVPDLPDRHSHQLSGSVVRSDRVGRSQVIATGIGSPHKVALRRADIEEKTSAAQGGQAMAPQRESHGMKKYSSRQSMDSGVYSADSMSLSDL